MMRIKLIFCLCTLIYSFYPGYAAAAVTGYEQNIAEALYERTDHGEAVWLSTGSEKFLGIYSQQPARKVKGAVIILHGMGAHPDWPEVITPLRTSLPATGWATFSIQMPLLEPGDPLSDYGKTMIRAGNRIRSAVYYLREKKFLKIVIIGHSFGALSAAYYLSSGLSSIRAFAGISMQDYDFLNPRLKLAEYLGRIEIPVLDIFGSRDIGEVVSLAEDRRLQARKMNRDKFQQIEIEGADHDFTGMEEILIRRISDWLDEAVPDPVRLQTMD